LNIVQPDDFFAKEYTFCGGGSKGYKLLYSKELPSIRTSSAEKTAICGRF
jgi:hypothetical protein